MRFDLEKCRMNRLVSEREAVLMALRMPVLEGGGMGRDEVSRLRWMEVAEMVDENEVEVCVRG